MKHFKENEVIKQQIALLEHKQKTGDVTE